MGQYLLPISCGLFVFVACSAIYLLWPARVLARLRRDVRGAAEMEDRLRREALLAAKEEGLRYREKIEDDLRDREREVLRREENLGAQADSLERRRIDLDGREAASLAKDRELCEREGALDQELVRISRLSRQEAEARLMERVESRQREASMKRARQIEEQMAAEADRRATEILLGAMERLAVQTVGEATVSVIQLCGDDMKGRIIGREGRNIRAFEQITGTDLIIDDTPEAVVVSCFDPVRREVARLTLEHLVADGRIHPVRIEELYEKAQAEVQAAILDAGRQAVETAQVGSMDPKIVEMLGRLKFRTSFAQNILDHSVEVSRLAGLMAADLGLDAGPSKRAGLLHDIGKALGPEADGPHAVVGMDFLSSRGETEVVARAVGAHHDEIDHRSFESVLVALADTLSASRPGSRKESLDNYVKRLSALEQLANGFAGVERSYAVQAGREVRIIVKPSEIDDDGAAALAIDVARRIEKDLDFPGQIRVTVIRETRSQEVAK